MGLNLIMGYMPYFESLYSRAPWVTRGEPVAPRVEISLRPHPRRGGYPVDPRTQRGNCHPYDWQKTSRFYDRE